MKNTLTKKEIKSAPKYIVRVDLKSSMNYNYGILESTDLLSAMLESEEGYHDDEAYLLDIFEKTDVVDNEMNTILYRSTVRSREAGSWHACDSDHCERPLRDPVRPALENLRLRRIRNDLRLTEKHDPAVQPLAGWIS